MKVLARSHYRIHHTPESLMPVHAYRHCEIKMTNAASAKFCRNKPASKLQIFRRAGLDTDDLATQKAGRIDE